MGAQGVMTQGKKAGAVVAALLLAACGQADGDLPDGGTVAPEAQAAVDNLPEGFTPYPAADVTAGTAISTGTGGGVIMVMASTDPAEKVIDFYRAQAEAAGVTISQSATAGSNHIIGGEGPDGLALTASAAPGADGVTIIQLTVGRD